MSVGMCLLYMEFEISLGFTLMLKDLLLAEIEGVHRQILCRNVFAVRTAIRQKEQSINYLCESKIAQYPEESVTCIL